jgi:hypothetical protein
MEPKTIKTTAAALGIADASVRRTLKRWIDDAEKSRLFTNAQRSFIQSIKADTVWPDWLDAIWCENYQPRAKDADARVVKIEPSRVDAPVATLLDKTAGVFDESFANRLQQENDMLNQSLDGFQAEIDRLRVERDALQVEVGAANSEISEHASTIKQMRSAMLDMGVKYEKEKADYIEAAGRNLLETTQKWSDAKLELETANELHGEQITNLTHERDQESEAAREAFAAWQEAMAKIEAYEADTWRKRIADAVKYAFSDYLIPKVVLLAFQSYIYAMYVMRVFAFLNTQVGKRADIAETYADTALHEPWFYGMWVLGFFVDGAGFAIAQKLSEPKYLSDGDTRLTWIGWFFALQVVIDMCYLFGTFLPIIEWFGAVVIVVAPALGIMAYARATFKKGQA